MSVNCTDDFMKRIIRIQEIDNTLVNTPTTHQTYTELQNERDALDVWNLIFPDTTHPDYKSDWTGDINLWQAKGFPIVVYHTMSTTKLWNLIMESTFTKAEPGIIFLDRANYYNPLNYAETIIACNPCGEQMLAPAGICCLGSLNLTQFVNDNRDGFDLDRVAAFVKILVRFLDNVNTYSSVPLPEYKESMTKKRRIGCGVMGWGSSLFMMKTPFGSEQAANIREELMLCYARAAYEASIDLAVERGMFEKCDPQQHAAGVFVQSLGLSADYMRTLSTVGIRNSSLLSQQPNGNSSILANIVSGGIEPIFMPEYIRTVIISATPEHLANVTPNWSEGAWHETDVFKFVLEGDDQLLKGVDQYGVTYKIDKNRGLTKEVLCEDYGVRFLKQLGEWDPTANWAKTTTELTVAHHVSDLRGFARYTDSACSKTVNLPFDYPYEDFKNLYLDVYKTGYIKGFTTYRSGTLMTVLSAKEEKLADKSDEEIILLDVKLPDSSPATVKTLNSEGRKWYVTCVWSDDMTRPLALFVHTNSSEKNVTTLGAVDQLLALAKRKGIPDKHIDETLCKISGDNNTTKIARMISLNLRHGVLLKNIVAALDCVDGVTVVSFLFQIKKFLSSFIKDGEAAVGEVCPECGGTNVVYESGCKICRNCGVSKCS
jgi:ribonucleoside-diphosphate reductase alpha chain